LGRSRPLAAGGHVVESAENLAGVTDRQPGPEALAALANRPAGRAVTGRTAVALDQQWIRGHGRCAPESWPGKPLEELVTDRSSCAGILAFARGVHRRGFSAARTGRLDLEASRAGRDAAAFVRHPRHDVTAQRKSEEESATPTPAGGSEHQLETHRPRQRARRRGGRHHQPRARFSPR